MSIIAWLLGSQLGRQVALVGLLAASVLLLLWRVYAAGQAREKARQAEAALKNLRTRISTDDEIARLPASDRRERLREWMRE